MSRAFVKEADGQDFFEALPDRPVSARPNLVTERGLAAIEDELRRWRDASAQAQASGDRAALAEAARELRYWTARRASAELAPALPDTLEVRFGSLVTIRRDDGRVQRFRIVGEDEADPAAGTVSVYSPLAQAVLGARLADEASMAGGTLKVTAISR